MPNVNLCFQLICRCISEKAKQVSESEWDKKKKSEQGGRKWEQGKEADLHKASILTLSTSQWLQNFNHFKNIKSEVYAN